MKGRLYIELINGPFLVRNLGSVAEYGAGLKLLIERKQLAMHKSGTFVWLPDGDLQLFDAHEKQAKLFNICWPLISVDAGAMRVNLQRTNTEHREHLLRTFVALVDLL